MSRRLNSYIKAHSVYIVAFILSLVLSYWIGINQTVINPDGICYLWGADEFGKAGLRATMRLCPQAIWPFYSILIYTLATITHLDYTVAAYTVDAILTSISVLLFITIIKELGGSKRVLWFAAFVILSAHQFNSVRQYIVRDHGFWVCYLASFLCLLRYYTQPSFVRALLWSITLLAAALFRIEGAVFLIIIPLTAWVCFDMPLWQRRLSYLQLNTLLFLICAGLVGWIWVHGGSLAEFGRVGELPNQLQHGAAMMWTKYMSTQTIVTQTVLTKFSSHDAGLVVFFTLLVWYVVSVINNLSWIFALLVVYAWFTRSTHFSSRMKLVVVGYLIVNLVVTLGFFAENLFLAKRYLIALSLIFMLWVPFALEKLWHIKYKIAFNLAMFFILLTSLGGIFHFGHSKDYIREAGDWVAVHVPQNAKLYANDYQLMYYSRHFGTSIFTKIHEYVHTENLMHGKWKQYDYLALLSGKQKDDKAARLMQEIRIKPLRVFMSETGDAIYIFKVSNVGVQP